MLRIASDVLGVLSRAQFNGNKLQIVEQLERPLYMSTNKVLEAIGGKWSRKDKAHVFPEDMEVRAMVEETVAAGVYTDPRKEFEFFETSPELAQQLVIDAGVSAGDTVLEPEAGKGAIVAAILAAGGRVTAVEIQPDMVKYLNKMFGSKVDIHLKDFLQVPESSDGFDKIVMNPPFSGFQDIRHAQYAFKFLKPGGTLVAITSPSWTFRTAKEAVAFRDWFAEQDGEVEDLPEKSFASAGTNVATKKLKIVKRK